MLVMFGGKKMSGKDKNLLVPLFLCLISLIFVCQVKAEPSKLFVRDVEFNSDTINIGEEANIKMHIKNLSKNKTCCSVHIFCGGKKIKEEQITVEAQSSTPIYHSFDTSGMTKGSYSIETIIQSSDQEKIFDLGKINLVENSILSESSLNDSISIGCLESLVALLLIPTGIMSSIIVITQKKNKKSEIPEEEFVVEDVPKLLGGFLNMQQNQEPIDPEVQEAEGKNNYIC